MKLLGRGWQYSVYENGNGRVIKKYNNKVVAFWVMFWACFPFRQHPLRSLPNYYRLCREFAQHSLELVKKSHIEPELLGNPTIHDDLSYEQDRAIPLETYFSTCSYSEGCVIIDEFVLLQQKLIKYGLFDKSANIGKNFGLDAAGRVIMIDLGELLSDPEKIQKQIAGKPWLKHYVLDGIGRRDLEEYFCERMENL